MDNTLNQKLVLALICIGLIFILLPEGQKESAIMPFINTIAPDSSLSERELIENAINNTDKNVMAHIVFINVTTKDEVEENCQNAEVVGCTITKTLTATTEDTEGKRTIRIDTARIYIANKDALKPTCNSFENVVYHEIGHVVYNYQHNFEVNDSEIPAMEAFANAYADNFAKNKC